MNRPSINAFVDAVREYVGLVDSDHPVELFAVRRLLFLLQFHITAVETGPHAADADGPRPDDDSYRRAVGRLGGLGFDFYRVVFDPHDLDATDEPVFGHLSDDLADIYRDLADGLSMADAGHIEDACREWSFLKRYMWNIFSAQGYPALEGNLAIDEYQKQVSGEFIVLSNERDRAFLTDTRPAPEENLFLGDYYVFPPNLAWTMAFTHEDGWSGPFFAQHPLYSTLNQANIERIKKQAEVAYARSRGWL